MTPPDSVGKVVAEMLEVDEAVPLDLKHWATRLQALDRLRQEGERRDDAVVIPLHLYDEINATGAAWKERAEAAEAALREIRDSTFRSAVMLRSMADRALTRTQEPSNA